MSGYIPKQYRGVAYGGEEFDTRTHYVAWNGSLRHKTNPDSFNGDQPWEDQGFHSRGVHTTEGTNPPLNVKPVKMPAIQPIPEGHTFHPVGRPSPKKPSDVSVRKQNRARYKK